MVQAKTTSLALLKTKHVQRVTIQIIDNGYVVDHFIKDPIKYESGGFTAFFASYSEAVEHCMALEAGCEAERVQIACAAENLAASESNTTNLDVWLDDKGGANDDI